MLHDCGKIPHMRPLSARIRKARESSNLTRAELARRVGVSSSAAVQWELEGGTAPSVRNLIELATVTGLSFTWLATGRGSQRLPVVVANEFESQLLTVLREAQTSTRPRLLAVLKALARRVRVALIAIVCSLLVTASPRAQAGLHSGPDYDFLVALYLSTNGASWTVSTSWGFDDACQWAGVVCDQDTTSADNTSRVSRIDLSFNGLTGTIPPLSGLSELNYFSLDANQITGSIPPLTGLTNLSVFSVYSNQLTGPIPTLAGLTKLQNLVVDHNQLSGSIPSLTGLTQLQSFSATWNQLSGSIPCLQPVAPCASGLTNLQQFDVGHNQLVGTIPELAGLTNLNLFSAWGNHLTGEIPPFSGVLLGNLLYFLVDSNQLTGPLPDLSGLPSLINLFVHGNRLTGAVPAAPASLTSAILCPNSFTISAQPAIDPAWNVATGKTPWWADPYTDNECDDLFTDTFG